MTNRPANPQQNPAKKRVTIELPKELNASYANLAFITHTAAELMIDFAQVLPRTPKGKIVSRVLMSPMHAKAFLQALQSNVANYERQFGEIKIPTQPHLADQLFNFPHSDDGGGSGGGDDADES